jgi:molybdopterin/thiamine biosynthesis adenylyltransferase
MSFFSRQTGLIDPDKLTQQIAIVGAGGIGSWAALALTKLGCKYLSVFDFDKVEEQNVGCQIYRPEDIGRSKTGALVDILKGLFNDSGQLTAFEYEINKESPATQDLAKYDFVIAAVDNMDTRKIIFESLLKSKTVLIDGRMAGNSIQIFTIPMSDNGRVDFYKNTLFNSSEAEPVPCTERAVVYNCFVISGMIADNVAQLANEKVPPQELIIDLANYLMQGGLA